MVQANWEQLYDEHAAALVLYARQWVTSVSDAEDAVQDAFVRLLKSARTFGDRPVPILYQAVKWAALDKVRQRERVGRREETAACFGPAETLFECSLEGAERREQIEGALHGLAADQREVLVLHIWGNLSFREIGLTLGISQNTAASRYRYALKNLGAILNKQELIA
ncbi:MAG: sigma-70 family RNA polymerase sigma factor [Verrucomicrobia bacterium]|nr:sigma-70 family RNA polymerase sigma factor [Verrucomicrobiota bacterium]